MGCKGSKHALHEHGSGGGLPRPRAPEAPQTYSGLVGRHSVALRSSTLGTLSLDRAAAAAAAAKAKGVPFAARGDVETMMKAGNDGGANAKGMVGPSRSFGGWRPRTPPLVVAAAVPAKRHRRVAPRTPTKTPARAPEEINVWELMKGLDDDEDDDDGPAEAASEQEEDDRGVELKTRSAPGSPVFDPEIPDAFRKALDELSSPASPPVRPDAGQRNSVLHVKNGGIQEFPGIVRERVTVFQEKIDAKKGRKPAAPSSRPPPPPPESARRVVLYLTSLRGIRQTYEDCWSTRAVLRSYGVRVDERDLSLHAGYKAELRAALGGGAAAAQAGLPQVFADGRHLGGAEAVRRLHESGELGTALEACETAPAATKRGGEALETTCRGCGGVRFVPCGTCCGSCKVFVVDDEDGAGAFRRCPECNENGLVRCPVC